MRIHAPPQVPCRKSNDDDAGRFQILRIHRRKIRRNFTFAAPYLHFRT
jgi:hypothetical protein